MARLEWDKVGEHFYETGIDRVVLYPMRNDGTYDNGVAWNGVTAVNESPSGAEPTDNYADNIKYLSLMSAETFSATIEAYTYPDEFAACDGSVSYGDGVLQFTQQARQSFGLCYRSLVGNDIKGQDYGYKIHVIYGCKASPSEKNHNTVNESPEATTMSWSINTTPAPVKFESVELKPTSHVVIDCTKLSEHGISVIEDSLYGKTSTGGDATEATLPTPGDLFNIIRAAETNG